MIRDILSNNLDFTTFEFVAASHPSRTLLTHRSGPEDINKVEFFFEGINLPAEIDDEPASHGFVMFKIKPKSNLVVGQSIENEAEIYFDYNAAIVTNTVTTTIVPQLSTSNFELSHVSIHPNPARSEFSISLEDNTSANSVSIYNNLGQLVKIVRNPSNIVSISEFSAGTYLVKIETSSGQTTKQLIKI